MGRSNLIRRLARRARRKDGILKPAFHERLVLRDQNQDTVIEQDALG